MRGREAVDELGRVAAGGDNVAEIHDDCRPCVEQAIGEQLRAFEVPAQSVEV